MVQDHQLEKAETTVLTDYWICIVQNITLTLIEVMSTRKQAYEIISVIDYTINLQYRLDHSIMQI